MPTEMYRKLFTKLTPNSVVVTVNRRLSTFLQTIYAQQQANSKTWLTPNIMPWTTWLEYLWLNNQAIGNGVPLRLLTSTQEEAIWEQIIAQSIPGKHLLHTTASLAREAWILTQHWHISYDKKQFAQAEDSLIWQCWAKEFENLCHHNHWLDSARLPLYLEHCIKQNSHSPLPKQIFFVGFDELNPQIHRLLAILTKQGCHPEVIEYQNSSSTHVKLTLANAETEIQTMALWCQQRLRENDKNLIGCVVPDLLANRTQLFNIFSDLTLPFNISGGFMLHEYPLIHAALTILSITEEISLETISLLLRSPFLGNAEQEMLVRAELDAILRAQNQPEVFCQQLIKLAKQYNCPDLAIQFQAFTHIQQENNLLPSQWAKHFSVQLNNLGWPGERTLSSTEFQLYERWQKLLADLASLDPILNTISLETAQNQLYKLAQAPFQAKSLEDIPIQILGVLETAGLEFQHLWVMGMHDDAWPPPAKPNPYIPYSLQRALGLPHSSNERELQFCQLLTKRLMCSAPQVVFSIPQHENEKELRSSKLIADARIINYSDLNLPHYQSYASIFFNSANIEIITDTQAPSINSHEKISGGAAIFKFQAACPFRAFAYFRLGANGLAKICSGLNPADRGSLAHRVLEILWNKLNNQTKLIEHTKEQLFNITQNAIEIGLEFFIKKYPHTFKKHFIELEKKRLMILLLNWLEKEKQRPSFKVLATEQTQHYNIAHIPLRLRVDRIDELADGNHIIIDYKTSLTNINAWFGARLDEPQLPLYCIANSPSITGLLFAQLKNHKSEFKGIAAENLNIYGVKTLTDFDDPTIPNNWQTLLQQWRNELERLGKEFYEGNATVDPKYGDQTCRHCDLQLLCRIKDKQQAL